MLAALLILGAAPSLAGEFPNLRRFVVGSPSCREIVVIANVIGPAGRDRLALVDRAGNLLLLDLPDELPAIEQLLVSPDRELALSVSVGEGHQAVNLYRIADLPAAAGGGSEAKRLAWVDPYPYSWSDARWCGSAVVCFTAAGDYARLDREQRRPAAGPDMDDAPGGWEWLIAGDGFRRRLVRASP